MKIISKFKDYYDFVAGHDADPRKVYVRDARIISPHIKNAPRIDYAEYLSEYFLGEVWFCDRLYPYVQDIRANEFWWRYEDMPQNVIEYIYRLWTDRCRGFIGRQISVEGLFDIDLFKIKSKVGHLKPIMHYSTHRRTYKIKMNAAVHAPIAYTWLRDALHPEIVINGRLTDLKFNKVVSPSEAFTEIYNWIPYQEPPMPSDPTDMSRFENKGFSKKTSFRGK